MTDITAEKLESVEDPEVACLLLQAEVATIIPDWFLSCTSLTRLDLSAESIVTHIGDSFLAHCTSLTSVGEDLFWAMKTWLAALRWPDGAVRMEMGRFPLLDDAYRDEGENPAV